MISILSLACGAMAAGGTYLLFRRRFFDMLIGLVLIGHAVNLSLFVASNSTSGLPSIIGINQSTLPSSTLDPVPQALILTAIVISFGTVTLLAVLFRTSVLKENLHNAEVVDKKGFE